MDFVTKKEFEAAVSIIERALKHRQLEISSTHEIFDTLLIGFNGHWHASVPINRATFVPSDLAAKNRLHNLRNELKMKKEDNDKIQTSLVKLESEQQQLLSILPKLKE